MATPAAIPIGEWRFLPREASLARGAERRRLESRAAELLELLCRRKGEVVTQQELVDAIWAGRSVSANSIAVVVGDLRRALDDDARDPRYIETIPKRGYRLKAEPISAGPAPAEPPSPRRRRLLLAGIGGLLVAAAAGSAFLMSRPAAAPANVAVAIGAFTNETGSATNDALVAATRDLVRAELSELPRTRLVRDARAAEIVVRGNLVLWDGHAALALSAEDPRSDAVLWSGMAGGPPARLPRQVEAEIRELGARIAPGAPPAGAAAGRLD